MGREDVGYYPVMLELRAQRCLVVGGGPEALRKARGLLGAGASVKVVAPMMDPRLKQMPGLEIVERPFRTADLHGMRLVVVATDDEALNRTVARDAGDLGVLVNVVDCPALCSFILPATLKQGPVQVSISTGGASPALARKLRDRLKETVGPEYGELAQLLGELRAEAIAKVSDGEARARLFERRSDDNFLEMIRQGRSDEVRSLMRKLLDESAR